MGRRTEEKDGSCFIYLIGHAAVANDMLQHPRLLGCDTCLPLPERCLTEEGRAQAAWLAGSIGARRPSLIYSSPSLRCLETAEAIMSVSDAELHMKSSLKEADFGIWAGKTWPEIIDDDPHNYGLFLSDPATYGYPCGETLYEVQKRALPLLQKIVNACENQRIVVVAHPQINRVILAHVGGVPLHRARELEQAPGCINIIRGFRGAMALHGVNYTVADAAAEEPEEIAC